MKISVKRIAIFLGPLIYLVLQSMDHPQSMPSPAWDVLCVTLWMALWWVTEAVPIAVTALLPIVLFPLTGALSIGETTSAYGDKFVFLYLGGFYIFCF